MKSISLASMLVCLVAFTAVAQGNPGDVWFEQETGAPFVDKNYRVSVHLNAGTVTGAVDAPDTIQINIQFNNTYLDVPLSTDNGVFPPTFSNPDLLIGDIAELQMNHSGDQVGVVRLLRQGGGPTPVNLNSGGGDYSGDYTDITLCDIRFTPQSIKSGLTIDGTVLVLRKQDLDTIGTPQVIAKNVNILGRPAVYVDFNLTPDDEQTGIDTDPYGSFAQADNAVIPGGIVNLLEGSSTETPTITKAMTLQRAAGETGVVRIGVSSKTQADSLEESSDVGGYSIPAPDLNVDSWDLSDLWLSLLALLRAGAGNDEAGLESALYESQFPARQPGLSQDMYAVRLRSGEALDPASVWGTAQGPGFDTDALEWIEVGPGDAWVLFKPEAPLESAGSVTVSAGATTLSGVALPEVSTTFDVADAAEVSPDSDLEAAIVESAEGPVFEIDPDTVFETPQRVWLPVPQGVDPGALALYYYHRGDSPGWYPAEAIEGWLEPDSESLQIEDGIVYLGYTVNHAGTVELRPVPGVEQQGATLLPLSLLLAFGTILLVAPALARKHLKGA